MYNYTFNGILQINENDSVPFNCQMSRAYYFETSGINYEWGIDPNTDYRYILNNVENDTLDYLNFGGNDSDFFLYEDDTILVSVTELADLETEGEGMWYNMSMLTSRGYKTNMSKVNFYPVGLEFAYTEQSGGLPAINLVVPIADSSFFA